MADIHDIRAQLREIRHQPASSGSSGNLTFYLVAGIAVAAGFAVVLFMPKIFSVQRTASLPVFQESVSRAAAVVAQKTITTPAPSAVPQPANMSDYADKNADEVATMADAVCARTAQGHPNGSPGRQSASFSADTILHENEKLHCFLSEGSARFCAAVGETVEKPNGDAWAP